VHFDLSYTDFHSLGWKSAAVNLSDIAAMGGLPRFCLTSLGIPPSVSVEQVSEFYRGLNALLRVHQTSLVGGDTCSTRKGLVVSVVMLGEAKKKQVLTRAGAKPGDRIFVTGTLGDSAAGMELLKSGVRRQRSGKYNVSGEGSGVKSNSSFLTHYSSLITKHLRPVPRVEWGGKIAHAGCANSMIDISDGLSSDLSHICGQSGVGAFIFAERIPLSPSLRKAAAHLGKSPLQYALSGGEDYELLFTVPPAKIKKLLSLDLPVAEIGEITRTRTMLMKDGMGKETVLRPTGYNHFLRSRNSR
jgi:thiamine-monophosphate kinase